MKKLLICYLLFYSSSIVSAQYINYQSSEKNTIYLSKIGYLRAQLGVGVYGNGEKGEIIPTMTSMSLSLTCNSPIYTNMGIEWGITPKYVWGTKTGNNSDNVWKFTQNHFDLELPVLYNYRYRLNPDLYIKGLAGIFLQFGLSGNWSMEEKINGEKHLYEGDYFDSIKRFDSGLKLGVEVGWKRFSLAWYYNKGVLSLSEPDEKGRNPVTRSFESGVKLGYTF